MDSGEHRRPSRKKRRPRPGAPPGTLVVDAEAGQSRVAVIAYGPDGCHEEPDADLAAIPPLMEQWPVVWVNVDGLGDEKVLRRLAEMFALHRLALEDVAHVSQRPKVEQYGQEFFLVTHMLSLDDGLLVEQLSLFVTDKVVITFQERPGDCLDPVRNRIRQGVGRIRSAASDYLAYAIVDAVIDHYFPILEGYGERLDILEDAVLAQADIEVVAQLRRAKRDLLTLRRLAWPQRDAINALLREDMPLVQVDTRPYLRDCYDHITRAIDLLETYRELVSDLMAAHLAIISNQMNSVMKTLAVIATIFIPLTFVAGIYGMNFERMPELKWPWGYPAALVMMSLVAAAMVLYFRRKKWF